MSIFDLFLSSFSIGRNFSKLIQSRTTQKGRDDVTHTPILEYIANSFV